MALHKAAIAALMYMFLSITIIFSNKLVLTTYQFPSYILLALFQTLFTFVVIQTFFTSQIRMNDTPEISSRILPLSFCSALDIVMGIAGTGSLNLPLFTALRRLSNLFIMGGEYFLLRKKHTFHVHCSVLIMVLGAAIAAIGDITFDAIGYTYIFINNFSTAGKAVLTKSRLQEYQFSSLELLYFNSLFTLPILIVCTYIRCDYMQIINFTYWTDPLFICYFMFSCCSAVALNYSYVQCTFHTSALTTSILGVIKNILVTYAGMFIGGDYVYTHTNFVGLTISALGATLYAASTYKPSETNKNSQVKKVTIVS